VLSALLIFDPPAFPQDQDAARHAVEQAAQLVSRLKKCPPRQVVAEFKKEWVKETWGPPVDVEYDVQRTDSVIYPYLAIIEFTLVMNVGGGHKTKQGAEADNQLHAFLRAKYRNTYKIGTEITRLDSISVQDLKGDWGPRPAWPDACWDHSTNQDHQPN